MALVFCVIFGKVKTVNEETGEEEIHFEQKIDPGIHFGEVLNFFNFIKSIHEIEIAFTFFAMAVNDSLSTSFSYLNLSRAKRSTKK